MSYASYRHILREMVKFWPKIKIFLALDIKKLGISTENGKGGITREEKAQKIGALTTLTDDRWPRGRPDHRPIDQFVGIGNLKSLPCFVFSTVLLNFFKVLHISTSKDHFGQDIGPIASFEVDFGTIGG